MYQPKSKVIITNRVLDNIRKNGKDPGIYQLLIAAIPSSNKISQTIKADTKGSFFSLMSLRINMIVVRHTKRTTMYNNT
jgi:hypothetical protein